MPRALRLSGVPLPALLLVEKPPCTLHATSKIGSCYYETRTGAKQMALKRCFKKPHFHQHVWGFLCKGHFFFPLSHAKALLIWGLD